MQPQQAARETLDLVEEWVPDGDYGHEREYQQELQSYLDERLNESRGILSEQQNHAVSTERGRSNGDIVVDDAIGIELKRDLSNSQVDRLTGQIEKYRAEYDYVIVCACGIDDLDGWRRLQKKYEQSGFGMMDPHQAPVSFVHKAREDFGGGRTRQRDSSASRADSTNPAPAAGLDEGSLDAELDEALAGLEDAPEIVQTIVALIMMGVVLYAVYLILF